MLVPLRPFSTSPFIYTLPIRKNGCILSTPHKSTLPNFSQYSTTQSQPENNRDKHTTHTEILIASPLRKRKTHHLLTSPYGSDLKFMEYMGEELGFKYPADWYKIEGNHFYKFHAHSLLKKYGYSPSEVVMGVFKDHLWLPWKFTKVSEGFWDDKTNQKTFMKHLEVKLGYTKMEHWYSIEARHFIENGGYTLLQRYMSPRLVVMGLMNDHKWEEWLFKKVGVKFWDDLDNQRLFLENLGDKLGYVTMDDWYGIKGDHFIQHGGVGLLHKFKNSPSAVVKAVFRTHAWQIWKFRTIPRALLVEPRELKAYFDALAPLLGVRELGEWQSVSFRQLFALGPCWHVKQLGLHAALRSAYPSHEWGVGEWVGSLGLSNQLYVASLLRRHLPGVEVLENFKHKLTQFDHSGNAMSIDVFIPSLSLGLEYNGAQHYQDINTAFLTSTSNPKKHDALKLAQFLAAKYTFIHIPWWWDGRFASLQDIIHKHRPDIVFEHPSA